MSRAPISEGNGGGEEQGRVVTQTKLDPVSVKQRVAAIEAMGKEAEREKEKLETRLAKERKELANTFVEVERLRDTVQVQSGILKTEKTKLGELQQKSETLETKIQETRQDKQQEEGTLKGLEKEFKKVDQEINAVVKEIEDLAEEKQEKEEELDVLQERYDEEEKEVQRLQTEILSLGEQWKKVREERAASIEELSATRKRMEREPASVPRGGLSGYNPAWREDLPPDERKRLLEERYRTTPKRRKVVGYEEQPKTYAEMRKHIKDLAIRHLGGVDGFLRNTFRSAGQELVLEFELRTNNMAESLTRARMYSSTHKANVITRWMAEKKGLI
jgi:chromosome segregation ATPase